MYVVCTVDDLFLCVLNLVSDVMLYITSVVNVLLMICFFVYLI